MATSDDDDDPVVQEVDVFLSKQLSDTLYLFQYPVRPVHMKYDDIPHLSARIKPQQQKVELELVLDTHNANYERSKGEQIALNVDGASGSGDQGTNFYVSDRMDKQVLTSVQSGLNTGRFVAGCIKNGELHLTPLKAILHLRPSFNYLDKVDSKQGVGPGGEESQDEEEEAKPVTVRFARRDEGKFQSTSYKYVSKRLESEPWTHLVHHQISDPMSESERFLLCAQHMNEVSEFQLTQERYLEKLVTKEEEGETQKPPMPSNVLSMTELKTMTLADQIKALLINAKVMRFSQLMNLLNKGTDMTSALRCLQQVALMVQGCWVVKSDVLYPKDSCSPHSGVPAETQCRARDYVMWRFTQNRIVIRKDISSVVKVPAEEVKEILEQMARLKVNKGWEFLFENDTEFISRHPEVVQRQLMLWDAKFQQLSKTLKISKADLDRKARSDELAASSASNSPEKPKRRRTMSRSRTRSTGGSGVSDMSDGEVGESPARARRASGSTRARKNSGRGELPTKADVPPPSATPSGETPTTEAPSSVLVSQDTIPMETVLNGAQNVITSDSDTHSQSVTKQQQQLQDNGAVPSKDQEQKQPKNSQGDLKRELDSFIRDKLTSRFVLSMSEVKTQFSLELASLPSGHILGSGVSDKMLADSMTDQGAILIPGHTEPVYALETLNDGHDDVRHVMLSMLKNKNSIKSQTFKQKMEETLKVVPSEVTWKKILRDYCVTRGSQWVLKGTAEK